MRARLHHPRGPRKTPAVGRLLRDGRRVLWERYDVVSEAEFHEVYPKVPIMMRDLQHRDVSNRDHPLQVSGDIVNTRPIPEPLLVQLRAYREQRRLDRANRKTMAQGSGARSLNLIDSLRRLFSGDASVDAAADDYLRTMDSWEDEIEAAHDAFLLYPGMGPMLYLTTDGRVLEDSRGWDGETVAELTGDQANAALVLGSKKTGIPDLLKLIPPMPPGARACPKCDGTKVSEPVKGFGHELACTLCGSRGWVD